LKAKTNYYRCRIKLIVKRLKAKLKAKLEELNIRVKARLEAKQNKVKSSIKVLDEFEGYKECNNNVDKSINCIKEPLNSL
jgi:dynactin complex subunit